ncbi:MAG: metal-sulfur cluster assembly factor [Betaproteobacteria bacterium]|nr:metal-sulfur cluster assembly factor [Betaproteobacteria bacterium]
MADEESIREALRSVNDPEVGMNIVDLGLVYGVEVSPERVHVTMTMTSPTCPMGDLLVETVRSAVRQVAPDVRDVEVELVWDPPWTAERMNQEARKFFGW